MKLRHSFFLGSALLAAATTANAAPYTWDGTAGLWSTFTAWSPDLTVALTNADDVTFDSTGTANLTTAMGGGNQVVKSITFNSASSYTVRLYSSTSTTTTARSLTTGNITVSSGDHTILGNKPGTGTSGSLRLASGIYDIASNSSLTFDARVGQSGTASYSKTRAGTLVLNADNSGSSAWTHTGFAVSQGVLRFGANGAFGTSGNTYAISSGAALEIIGGVTQNISTGAGKITLNGTGISGNGALLSTSGNNFLNFTAGATGGVVLASDSSIGVDADTLTINQAISGASKNLTKVGAGTLTLTNTANTYSGETIIKAGTVKLNAANTIDTSSKITVGDAGSSGTVLDVTTAGLTVSSGKTLAGIGTVTGTGKTVTINGTHAVGNAGTDGGVGTQTVTATTLAYGAASIFEWDINTGTATYDKVALTGALSVDAAAVFKVVSSTAFTDAYWNTTREWTDIFGSSSLAGFDLTNFVYVANGATVTAPSFASEGSFSINTNTLKWTAVPEPTSALAGLLLTAGLLRRRRP